MEGIGSVNAIWIHPPLPLHPRQASIAYQEQRKCWGGVLRGILNGGLSRSQKHLGSCKRRPREARFIPAWRHHLRHSCRGDGDRHARKGPAMD
ncbi:hypothetical protein GW17_00023057 [Ensete ventricosum]|nr:hypothetical protein GW17_00023057 [Ensete ventricosum]